MPSRTRTAHLSSAVLALLATCVSGLYAAGFVGERSFNAVAALLGLGVLYQDWKPGSPARASFRPRSPSYWAGCAAILAFIAAVSHVVRMIGPPQLTTGALLATVSAMLVMLYLRRAISGR